MPGGLLPQKIIYHDVQEAIDKYKNWYNEIINKNLSNKKLEDQLAFYGRDLVNFLGMSEKRREIIKTLSNGEYHINVKSYGHNTMYKLEILKRKKDEDIGATEEQILELQDFVTYLEREDVVNRLKKFNKSSNIALMIILLIPIYLIVHFALAKSHVLQILFLILVIIVYISGIKNIKNTNPYS